MKVGLSIIILSILLSLCTIGHCYRILGIFPRNSKSQFSVFEVLMKSLADRGHQVDVVSSFPLEHSYDNYHDIIKLPQTSPSLTNNVSYVDIHKKIGTVLGMIKTERGNDVCQALGNSDLMKIIQNPPKDIPYDVVITEMLIANCFMVVGHFLKVPVVGVSTYGRLPWVYDIMGNPEHSNFVSNEVTHQFYPGFWQRIKSFFKDSYEKCSFYHGTQAQDGILTKIFGKKTPTVRELESSVALALTNSHFVSHGQAPVVPGVVEVGGMHIVEERIEPLFDDILDFLDTSKHGVVYVNLGEDLLFETLPEHIIKAFYTTFENIRPIRVLLRIRDFDALPPGIPPNVVTVPWVQQYRVLQHPNTRVFVTHGGILGVQEAMAAGTIMLGIPLGGDQFENIDMVVEHNLGMRLDLDSITVETLGQALNRTLKNETFRKKAQEMMDKFFDRPELPVDTACYWIEYVIKHGSSSLKSPFMKLSWFQTSFFDVFSFFSFIAFMIIFLTVFFVKRIVMGIVSKLRRKTKSKKLL